MTEYYDDVKKKKKGQREREKTGEVTYWDAKVSRTYCYERARDGTVIEMLPFI